MPRLGPVLTLAALVVLTAGSGAAAESRGRVAVVQGGDESRLVVMHPDGSGARTLVRREFGLQSPAWRPDGRALAFVSSRGGGPGIYMVNDDGTGLRPLLVTKRGARDPAFSPDGRRIAYLGNRGLFVARADGSERRRLTRALLEDSAPTWSPDGKRIAFVRDTADMLSYLCVVSVGSGRIRRLTRTTEWAASPAWAPNGKSIAFARRPVNSDVGHLAIMRPDGRGLRNVAPHLRDVVDLSWSPDSRELAFTRKIRPDSEVFRIRLSDNAVRKVTRNSISDQTPAWGPVRG
jgi:Tol biopolymer transport system component